MTILSGHCSDSVLRKRKDTEPCRSQFAAEEEEEEEAAATENKDAATENKDTAAQYEDAVSKNKCRVCLQVGHWPFRCPYKRCAPEGTEVVGHGYTLVCYYCGLDEFNLDKSCVMCGTSLKRICGIFCGICSAEDHLSRNCPYKGMVDLTSNFDFYVPPPAGAQGVCIEE